MAPTPKKGALSSKLLTMKFMTNAATSTRDTAKAEQGRPKATDDSHWRLTFADDEERRRKRRQVEQVEYVSSYEMLPRERRGAADAGAGAEVSGGAGRRSFGMAKKSQETTATSEGANTEQRDSDEEEEETEEATAKRRAAERKADHANLKKMKGLSSLSGQPITNPGKTQKRKSTDSASSSANKKKSKR